MLSQLVLKTFVMFCKQQFFEKLSPATKNLSYVSLRGQTVQSVHCMRIPQQAKIRFFAESATLLHFFDLSSTKGIPQTNA